jgi:hypothetical protein
MKEPFFTSGSLETKALGILQQLQAYRRERLTQLIPECSALLVLDMQRYFLEASSHAYIPSAAAIIPGIKDMVRAYTERGLPIIFTRHINTPQDAGLMATWWRELITVQNPLGEITSELDLSGGAIIHKSQYDAFYTTPLADLLRNRAAENRLSSYIDPSQPPEGYRVVDALRAAGYEVIISIGEVEENLIGSNCGQYLHAHLAADEPVKDGYTYRVHEYTA